MCAIKARDKLKASRLFLQFLREQNHAYRTLKERYPTETVDLYQDRIEDLLANLKVLMYYKIGSAQLDALLQLRKAHGNFKLLDETGLAPEAYRKAVSNLEILLYRHGQLNTFKENRPVDAERAPIPWITYPALEFLSQFDYAESDVFEFGSGNSTLFWARRARNVVSIETDKDWFATLNRDKPSNVQLFHLEGADEFAGSILKARRAFDVIVIDSAKHRYAAALNAVNAMSGGGMVILDNSDWYPNSCRLLRDAGLLQIDFHGLGPVNGYAWTTSIFFKERLKFRRLADAVRPVGGIDVQPEDDGPPSSSRGHDQ